jgi:membrane-associated phospholipid phosphatase
MIPSLVHGTLALGLAFAGPRGYAGPTDVVAPTLAGPVATVEPPPPRPAASPRERLGPHRVPDFGRVRARWALDASITAGAGIPVLVLNRWVGPQLARPALPTDPPELGRVDAIASGRYDPRVSTASDVMVAVALAAAPLVSLVDGHWAAQSAAPSARRRAFAKTWGTAVLVEAEAVAIAGLVTNVMKHAIGRPRPYTTLAEADVAARDRDELAHDLRAAGRSHSFPSGHSTLAFAAVTSLATILTLDAPRTQRAKVAIALAWSLGLLTAGTTAALRVVAGKHYPSDIIAGSAIGAAVGVATPLLHARRRLWRFK